MHWYTGRKIYLEHNLIIDLMRRTYPDFSMKVDTLFKENYVFPYSPAHIEEVAVINRTTSCEDARRYIDNHLGFISKISRNLDILPAESLKRPQSRIQLEHPIECYKRVMNNYEQTTLWCEKNEEFLMSCKTRVEHENFCSKNPDFREFADGTITDDELQKRVGIDNIQDLNNIPYNMIFEDAHVKEAINIRLQLFKNSSPVTILNGTSKIDDIPKYITIKGNHNFIQDIINFLIKSLHAVGYCRESNSKSRSFMHDITHTIYATQADYFINNDTKSRTKAKAVYDFLQIPCQILSKDDFLKEDFLSRPKA